MKIKNTEFQYSSPLDGNEHLRDLVSEAPPDIGSYDPDLVSSSGRYAKRFQGPAGDWLLKRQSAILRELIRTWPSASVLDIGGGHAQVARPLIADGHRLRVRVSSPDALGQLSHLDSDLLSTETGPLTELPHADRSFDVVTSIRILAHVCHWDRLVAEMCRVARHAVIIDFPTQRAGNLFGDRLFALKKRVEGDTRRYRLFRHEEVRAHLAAQGFATGRAVGQFVLPMVVHRVLKRPGLSSFLEGGLAAMGGAAIATPVILCARRDPDKPPADLT